MWIQLLLPMKMPEAPAVKRKKVRRPKPIMGAWLQLELPMLLVDLLQYEPSLLRRLWNRGKRALSAAALRFSAWLGS